MNVPQGAARAGGPWLCSTLVRSLFQAVVVPSGLSTRVQPHRWITTWCLLERLPRRAGVRPGSSLAAVCVVGAAAVQLCAQLDQVLKRRGVDVPGDDRGHSRVTRDRFGGVPVQPRPAIAAALGRLGPAGRPGGADLRGPLLLQGRAALEPEQVGQRHVRPGLDRLPGPLGQQIRRGQAAHALVLKMHRELDHIFVI